MSDGVLERLFDSGRSARAIAERAGLPWQVIDAVIAHCMPGDEARLPPALIESLERVLPPRRATPNGPRPLVGTRADLPLLIVDSQPARMLAWLAENEPAEGRAITAAVLSDRLRARQAASSIIGRLVRDHGLLRAIDGHRPYRYTLTPLGWRCADALARWPR